MFLSAVKSTGTNTGKLLLALSLLLLSLSSHASNGAVQVSALRLDTVSDGLRVIVELSDKVAFDTRNGFNNISLLLHDVKFDSAITRQQRIPANSPITRLELFPDDKPIINIAFHEGYSANSLNLLEPNSIHGYRLIIKISDDGHDWFEAPKAQKSGQFVVVIDPGHGGEDPGAYQHGILEKDVVLNVARHLQRQLNNINGVNAILTRDDDSSLALLERRLIAARNNADLFVSLHANSYPQDARIQGAIVFSLADKGANSAFMRMLVDTENRADEYAALSGYGEHNHHIQRVVAELALGATRNESAEVGEYILQELGGITKLHSNDVQQANFAVLKSAAVPSLLVEMGFLSNKAEAERLSQATEQLRYAQAMAEGLRAYLQDNNKINPVEPPPITLAAQLETEPQSAPSGTLPKLALNPGDYFNYAVKRGDTLSGLAQQHKVSLNFLRKVNKLNSDTLFVGQKLRLPSFRFQEIQVNSGDTLSQLALNHGVSIEAILAVNDISSGQKIYRGQRLYIPKLDSRYQDSRYQAYITYQVKRGDNLSDIARNYGLSTDELLSINQLNSSRIYPGQMLKIPANRAPAHFVHMVKWGETLSGIAQRYGLTVERLSRFNSIRDGKVYEGDRILIPQPNVASYTLYRVDAGDTLSGIAQRFNIDTAEVQNINNLGSTTTIFSGQQLKIPLQIR